MSIFKAPISSLIWDTKYRYKWRGEVIDQTIEDTWHRVAQAVAQAEKPAERLFWERRFYQVLEGFQFLPGGRILAGAGTSHQVTLFNCFVMNIGEDSLDGIFGALREGALTLQQGGGVGYDFSVLRPAGEMTKKTGTFSSGPVSFMYVWDAMCAVLLSTGARRGAMMGVLRIDHPDIETFIAAKEDPRALRHFNVSVMVSDAFMKAVKNDDKWALVFPLEGAGTGDDIVYRQWGNTNQAVGCRVYRYVNARDLWHKIIHSAYHYAEPGVLFVDTINRMNNLWYREDIHATNPCGEIPLPAYGACNLGAINLTQFVMTPFSEKARINWAALEETVSVALRFQDNVIDVSHYPLVIQHDEAQHTRRIGLGITGLADMFIMLGVQYGSTESISLARELMKKIAEVSWRTSIALAHEKGMFPYYHPDYLKGEFVKSLDPSIQTELAKHGVRNSHHNTIAPTGTISLLANNVSNGIEPVFQAEYERQVRLSGNEAITFHVKDYAYECWKETHTSMPPAWIDTNRLDMQVHLQIQAAMQPYIDNAISKTINLPHDFPFSSLESVYTQAYELGLKGCTVFRPNPITGSILQVAGASAAHDYCQHDGCE